jgi:uroporphyrinogen decarboxylase
LGVKVYLHICGNCQPLLDLMAETGVDAIEPLDVDGGVDLEVVKAGVGGRVCLKGGLSTMLLLNGTPEQVYREARRCISIFGPIGYILGSADDIPRDTPFANIDAMVKAALDS